MLYVLTYVNRTERHKKMVIRECRVYIFYALDDEEARYKANIFLKNGRRLFKRGGGQRVEISLAPRLIAIRTLRHNEKGRDSVAAFIHTCLD